MSHNVGGRMQAAAWGKLLKVDVEKNTRARNAPDAVAVHIRGCDRESPGQFRVTQIRLVLLHSEAIGAVEGGQVEGGAHVEAPVHHVDRHVHVGADDDVAEGRGCESQPDGQDAV